MRNPQKSLGLAPGSKISGIVISANEQLAREVAFDNIVTKVSASPYFKENTIISEWVAGYYRPDSS